MRYLHALLTLIARVCGYRGAYYGRKVTTTVGTLELRVPQDRGRLFRTEVFARYQRIEKALLIALAEMRGAVRAGERRR